MFYVSAEELIPEMSEGQQSNPGTIAYSIGFVVMMIPDMVLGLSNINGINAKRIIMQEVQRMLEIGTKAPEFSLPDQDGKIHSLSEYNGQKVILYFYPADMSPGYTNQACNFRDFYPQIREKGAVVLGVNADTAEFHKKFQEEHGLPFTLLSDTDKTVLKAYDVWKEKSMFGRTVWGIERSTYLIDENGIIEKAFGKVKPKDNAKQMLRELS